MRLIEDNSVDLVEYVNSFFDNLDMFFFSFKCPIS